MDDVYRIEFEERNATLTTPEPHESKALAAIRARVRSEQAAYARDWRERQTLITTAAA